MTTSIITHGLLVYDRRDVFAYGIVKRIDWSRLADNRLAPEMIMFENEEGHQFVRPAIYVDAVTKH